MEFYDSKNEGDDSLPGGKKKKKQSAEQDGWREYSSDSQSEAEEKARKDLFDILASQEQEDKNQAIFYPDLKSESSNEADELQDNEDQGPGDKPEFAAPDYEAESHMSTVADKPYNQPETPPQQTVIQPTQSTTRKSLEDFFASQPAANRFVERDNTQEPEPERPVLGYNREEDEYYSGYVPGVPLENQPLQAAASGGSGEANTPPRSPNDAMSERGGQPYPPGATTFEARQQAAKKQENDSYAAERRGLRHGIVAGFLTGYILKSYLASRRRKREGQEFNKEISDQQKQLANLQAEKTEQQKRASEHERQIAQFEDQQRNLEERLEQKLASQPKPPAEVRPPVVYKPERKPEVETSDKSVLENPQYLKDDKPDKDNEKQEMIDAARRDLEKAVEDANKKRVEQDAWLRHELDEHGHEIEGQRRGQEYTHERAQELLQRNSQNNQQVSHKAGAQPVFVGQQPQYQQPTGPRPALGSGQVPADHRLPYDSHGAPYKRTKKQNALVLALTSPWTFLMLSLILLAYFIATLL